MSITLNGTVPGSSPPTLVTIIQANGEAGPVPGGILKFLFSAPQAGGAPLTFCIGPASNPCGSGYSWEVPGGEEQLAVVDAGVFTNSVLVVGQGTMDNLPFAVTIE